MSLVNMIDTQMEYVRMQINENYEIIAASTYDEISEDDLEMWDDVYYFKISELPADLDFGWRIIDGIITSPTERFLLEREKETIEWQLRNFEAEIRFQNWLIGADIDRDSEDMLTSDEGQGIMIDRESFEEQITALKSRRLEITRQLSSTKASV